MTSKLIYPAVQRRFVDREPERNAYATVLTFSDEKRIYCIEAADGWGKSWLLRRLYLDSPDEDQKILIDLKKDVTTELTLILKIAEKIGNDFLEQLQQRMGQGSGNTINFYAKNLTIQGDVVGGDKNISMNQSPYESSEQLPRFNQEFRKMFQEFQSSKRVILFLDRFEETTQPVQTWLLEQLFTAIWDDRKYENIVIVISSSKPFECFNRRDEPDWDYIILDRHLKGLPEEAIREYWLKIRELPQAALEEKLEWLQSHGNSPWALSDLADSLKPQT